MKTVVFGHVIAGHHASPAFQACQHSQDLHACSWAIGTDHTRAQRQAFEAQLHQLQQALEGSGGPFLAGDQASLVTCQRCDCVAWTLFGIWHCNVLQAISIALYM